jgi:tetratricopeptide (TPR) repeat protein
LQRVQQVLEKTPKSAEAWLLKGSIYRVQKKWNEAETALKQAIGADAGYLPASQLLTRVYVESRQLPRAMEQARQVLDKQPGDRQSLIMAAMISEAQGDFAKAADYFEKRLLLDPGSSELMNSLACLYADHLNDPEKAYKLALEARRLRPPADPSQPLASRQESSAIADTLGWIRYKRKEYRDALQLVLEASRDIGDNPEVQYHLGMAAAMMGQMEVARKALIAALKPEGGLPAAFPARPDIQARLTLLGGAEATAKVTPLAELENAATKQPNDPLVQFLLANAREKEKDFERAAAAYEKTIEQNPNLVAAVVSLARLNSGPLHKPQKALELAKKARDILVDDPAATGPLGVIVFDAGDYAWAYDLLGQSTRATKPDMATLRSFAWASYSQGKMTEARAIMQRVIDEAPASAEAGDAKSFLSMTTRTADGKVSPELVSAAGNALKTDPDNVPALMIQARNQAQGADPGPAESTLNAVLKKYPAFTPAQIELADLYARQPGTRDKAWELATAARKVQPEDAELIKVLAALSYHKKDYDYAIQLLQPAAAKNSLNAEALFYLGMSQWQKNDKEAGRSALTKALEMGLPAATKEEAARILEGGKK